MPSQPPAKRNQPADIFSVLYLSTKPTAVPKDAATIPDQKIARGEVLGRTAILGPIQDVVRKSRELLEAGIRQSIQEDYLDWLPEPLPPVQRNLAWNQDILQQTKVMAHGEIKDGEQWTRLDGTALSQLERSMSREPRLETDPSNYAHQAWRDWRAYEDIHAAVERATSHDETWRPQYEFKFLRDDQQHHEIARVSTIIHRPSITTDNSTSARSSVIDLFQDITSTLFLTAEQDEYLRRTLIKNVRFKVKEDLLKLATRNASVRLYWELMDANEEQGLSPESAFLTESLIMTLADEGDIDQRTAVQAITAAKKGAGKDIEGEFLAMFDQEQQEALTADPRDCMLKAQAILEGPESRLDQKAKAYAYILWKSDGSKFSELDRAKLSSALQLSAAKYKVSSADIDLAQQAIKLYSAPPETAERVYRILNQAKLVNDAEEIVWRLKWHEGDSLSASMAERATAILDTIARRRHIDADTLKRSRAYLAHQKYSAEIQAAKAILQTKLADYGQTASGRASASKLDDVEQIETNTQRSRHELEIEQLIPIEGANYPARIERQKEIFRARLADWTDAVELAPFITNISKLKAVIETIQPGQEILTDEQIEAIAELEVVDYELNGSADDDVRGIDPGDAADLAELEEAATMTKPPTVSTEQQVMDEVTAAFELDTYQPPPATAIDEAEPAGVKIAKRLHNIALRLERQHLPHLEELLNTLQTHAESSIANVVSTGMPSLPMLLELYTAIQADLNQLDTLATEAKAVRNNAALLQFVDTCKQYFAPFRKIYALAGSEHQHASKIMQAHRELSESKAETAVSKEISLLRLLYIKRLTQSGSAEHNAAVVREAESIYRKYFNAAVPAVPAPTPEEMQVLKAYKAGFQGSISTTSAAGLVESLATNTFTELSGDFKTNYRYAAQLLSIIDDIERVIPRFMTEDTSTTGLVRNLLDLPVDKIYQLDHKKFIQHLSQLKEKFEQRAKALLEDPTSREILTRDASQALLAIDELRDLDAWAIPAPMPDTASHIRKVARAKRLAKLNLDMPGADAVQRLLDNQTLLGVFTKDISLLTSDDVGTISRTGIELMEIIRKDSSLHQFIRTRVKEAKARGQQIEQDAKAPAATAWSDYLTYDHAKYCAARGLRWVKKSISVTTPEDRAKANHTLLTAAAKKYLIPTRQIRIIEQALKQSCQSDQEYQALLQEASKAAAEEQAAAQWPTVEQSIAHICTVLDKHIKDASQFIPRMTSASDGLPAIHIITDADSDWFKRVKFIRNTLTKIAALTEKYHKEEIGSVSYYQRLYGMSPDIITVLRELQSTVQQLAPLLVDDEDKKSIESAAQVVQAASGDLASALSFIRGNPTSQSQGASPVTSPARARQVLPEQYKALRKELDEIITALPSDLPGLSELKNTTLSLLGAANKILSAEDSFDLVSAGIELNDSKAFWDVLELIGKVKQATKDRIVRTKLNQYRTKLAEACNFAFLKITKAERELGFRPGYIGACIAQSHDTASALIKKLQHAMLSPVDVILNQFVFLLGMSGKDQTNTPISHFDDLAVALDTAIHEYKQQQVEVSAQLQSATTEAEAAHNTALARIMKRKTPEVLADYCEKHSALYALHVEQARNQALLDYYDDLATNRSKKSLTTTAIMQLKARYEAKLKYLDDLQVCGNEITELKWNTYYYDRDAYDDYERYFDTVYKELETLIKRFGEHEVSISSPTSDEASEKSTIDSNSGDELAATGLVADQSAEFDGRRDALVEDIGKCNRSLQRLISQLTEKRRVDAEPLIRAISICASLSDKHREEISTHQVPSSPYLQRQSRVTPLLTDEVRKVMLGYAKVQATLNRKSGKKLWTATHIGWQAAEAILERPDLHRTDDFNRILTSLQRSKEEAPAPTDVTELDDLNLFVKVTAPAGLKLHQQFFSQSFTTTLTRVIAETNEKKKRLKLEKAAKPSSATSPDRSSTASDTGTSSTAAPSESTSNENAVYYRDIFQVAHEETALDRMEAAIVIYQSRCENPKLQLSTKEMDYLRKKSEQSVVSKKWDWIGLGRLVRWFYREEISKARMLSDALCMGDRQELVKIAGANTGFWGNWFSEKFTYMATEGYEVFNQVPSDDAALAEELEKARQLQQWVEVSEGDDASSDGPQSPDTSRGVTRVETPLFDQLNQSRSGTPLNEMAKGLRPSANADADEQPDRQAPDTKPGAIKGTPTP